MHRMCRLSHLPQLRPTLSDYSKLRFWFSCSGASHWSAMPAKPWDKPSGRSSWDRPAEDAPASADEEDEDPENPSTPEAATDALSDMLIDMVLKRSLSAKQACNIAWYAMKAGLGGSIAEMALKPSSSSGHFQRKLDAVMGHQQAIQQTLYELDIPSYNRHQVEREVRRIPVLPPHEAIVREVAETPELRAKLADVVSHRAFPDDYYNHPVVRSAPPGTVFPLQLFVDGVPTTKRDGLIGFHLVNIVSGARHISVCLRKSRLCACGCKGWCSLHQVWVFLQWSFASLALGRAPGTRHDGKPWLRSDAERATLSNAQLALGISACLLHIKGDWMEMVTSFGFPSWNDKCHPCWACECEQPELYHLEQADCLSWPFRLKNQASYNQACLACERVVVVRTKADLNKIVATLAYDHSSSGPRGRALRAALPEFGLEKGDRVEPSEAVADVGEISDLALPVRLTFWRRSAETATRHRNPLFKDPKVASVDLFAVDELHCIHLGIYNFFVAATFSRVVDANIFQVSATNQETKRTLNVARLRAELMAWYTLRRREHPEEPVYPLQDLPNAMFNHSTIKSKAAETGSLVPFAVDLLRRFGDKLVRGLELRSAGEALLRYHVVTRNSPRRLTVGQTQDRCIHDGGLTPTPARDGWGERPLEQKNL